MARPWSNAMPGTLRLHVDELDVHAPKGSKWRDQLFGISVTLSALRGKLGAEAGELTDAFGESHPISLAKWASSDPGTRVLVYFSYQQQDAPEGLRGSVYPLDVLARAHAAARA